MNVRVALVFGSVAMAGTYLGARLAVFFSGGVQLALFAAVMIVAAYFMFRENGPKLAEDGLDSEFSGKRVSYGLIVVEGLAVGVLTGLVGVGGGFLIVPALVVLGKVPMKEAVGTSLLVIAMKSAAGFVGTSVRSRSAGSIWGSSPRWPPVASEERTGALRVLKLRRPFMVFLIVMASCSS